MEHRTALALAGAVVMVGTSGAIAVGTLTGTIGPDAGELPAVGPPASVDPGPAAESRRAGGRGPEVTRVTRTIDVPVPAPPAPAAPAPAAPAVPQVRPPVGGITGGEVTDGDAAEETAEEASELLEERREVRAERLEERREEYREALEERREERQDRLEDLEDGDSSGHGGSSDDGGSSGHG